MSIEPYYATQDKIFPYWIPVDTQCLIIEKTDGMALIFLSQVSRFAYQYLNGATVFKNNFSQTYTWLRPILLFPHVQAYYPNNCWKIATYLANRSEPIVFNKASIQAAIDHQALNSCAAEEIPAIISEGGSQNPTEIMRQEILVNLLVDQYFFKDPFFIAGDLGLSLVNILLRQEETRAQNQGNPW